MAVGLSLSYALASGEGRLIIREKMNFRDYARFLLSLITENRALNVLKLPPEE